MSLIYITLIIFIILEKNNLIWIKWKKELVLTSYLSVFQHFIKKQANTIRSEIVSKKIKSEYLRKKFYLDYDSEEGIY